METKNKYTPNGSAITEIICSGLAILLVFLSWLTLYATDRSNILNVPSVYERLQGSGGPGAYIFIGSCILNIVMKFFTRSSWLSFFCAFFFGAMLFQEFQAMQEINNSDYYQALGAHCSISVGGFCALILELVFIVSTIIGIFQWLANSTRKTAKKLFVAALIGLFSLGIGFYLMMKGANSEEDIVLIFASIFNVIGIFLFLVCGLFGIIIWIRNKKEVTINDSIEIVEKSNDYQDTPLVETSVGNVANNTTSNVSLLDYETDKVKANDKKPTNRKLLYILGCILFITLLAGGVYLMWNNKTESGVFAGKPISELFPQVEKASDSGMIPDSPTIYEWDVSQGEECGGDVTVVRKADENQLVIMYETNSCDANILRLGVYQNGQYVFYYELPVGNLDYDETKNGISLHADLPESTIYYGYYGKDIAKSIEQEWGTEHSLDWNKVSENQLAELFKSALNDGPKGSPFILTYNEIKANMGGAAISENMEEKELSGFSYLVGNAEFGLDLYVDVDGEKIPTGISGTAETLDIFHQYDFDGDGEKEALVYEWGGGNAAYPPYIVYYDKESKAFKKAEGFETIFGESDVDLEPWKGKQSIVVKAGLETSRYIYENYQLKKVESKTADMGPELMTFTCKQLFDSNSEGEKSVNLDLNDDGLEEKLVFTSNDSHAFDDGNAMMLEKIIWGDGTETFGCHQVASSFTFLMCLTAGVHDMITNGRQLQKWSGEEYKE